ncbi:Hsp70 family protein [Rhodococcus fascians]|nr:Hsp70 family protein [Rhodococcus fascians]MBY4398113.1 Hsp70 family protein [Rhodococcus fascians]MBY4407942.1 Hsp70 family protein [Rhodococcus fascians]MBY4422886.1 Hsp70 family protein [Rhodococcus fascians]MBY4462322.1 Hsp70 family protein [Rhodococcus fascians]
MTVLLGVSMGTRAVRTAQPRADQFGASGDTSSALVTDVERPLFFRNELIDSATGDLPHLAAESIGAAAEVEPELSTGIAYRDPRQADALRAAFAGAHLNNYHLVPEVEAVIEYLAVTGEARGAGSVALFDLGSSGLTVSVVDLIARTVTASQRSGSYSGDLIDAYVRNNQLQRLGKPATDPDIALFEKRCRIAKERLSTQDAVCLPDASGMILLSRENFELLITDLLDEAIEFAREVMISANVPIDAVVLIGGGARMPIVQQRVGPLLELPSIVPTEPETVAARGAALAARPNSRTRTAPDRTARDAQASVPRRRHTDSAAVVPPAPVAPPVPVVPPAPEPMMPARSESQHAAPPVATPSSTRPVPARPWIAAASITESASAATGFESSKFADAPADTPEPSTVEAPPSSESTAVHEISENGVGEVSAVAVEAPAVQPVSHTSATDAAADTVEDGKPVPFQLKNIYWLDADYDDDDGEDDRTRARRRLRTGGVLAFCAAAVVAVSGFVFTHQNSPQVVDTSVSRDQTDTPVVTTVPTTTPAPVLLPPPPPPPPAPEPTTTVEPTTEQPETTWEQPVTTTETTTVEPPPAPVESVPPVTTQQPPPLIPGFPDFTLPGFPPIVPPAP